MEWDFVGWGYCVGFFFIFGDFGERLREIWGDRGIVG